MRNRVLAAAVVRRTAAHASLLRQLRAVEAPVGTGAFIFRHAASGEPLGEDPIRAVVGSGGSGVRARQSDDQRCSSDNDPMVPTGQRAGHLQDVGLWLPTRLGDTIGM